MSTTLRGLRRTPETYQIVAWYAGREGLSLGESLDRLVKTSGLARAKAAERTTTEPEFFSAMTSQPPTEAWNRENP